MSDGEITFLESDPDTRAVNEGTWDPGVTRNADTGEVELNVWNPAAHASATSFRTLLLWGLAAYIAWEVLG